MELKVSNMTLLQDFKGKLKVTFDVDKESERVVKSQFDNYHDKTLRLAVKPWRDKRSLDANAYMWTLCAKIADKLHITKEEVYRDNVKKLSDNFYLQLLRNDTIEPFTKDWESHGTGWFCQVVDESPQHPGFSWVNIYCGSSQYDTAQMSRLIENVIQDAKALDIETDTPEQIAKMVSRWESR